MRAVTLLVLGLFAWLAPAQAQNATQDKGARCDPAAAPGVALAPQEISGKWLQTQPQPGEAVEIKPGSAPPERPDLGELGAETPAAPNGAPTANDLANFTLHGSHDWFGTYTNGKLVFKRKPIVDEMSRDAPDWARQAVAGQIEWRLELEPKLVCGVRFITGKWFPGRIKIDENTDSAGNITSRSAKADGDGDPITMRYEQQQPAIYGVVVLDDQARISASGLPVHGYPFPIAPEVQSKNAALDPIPVEYPVPRLPPKNALGASGDRRMIFVYGQGLPRDYTSKINITGTTGGDGLEYWVQALDTDISLSPEDKKKLADGRAEAMKDINDPYTKDLAQKAQAMLVRVDLHRGVLAGLKEFTINGIGGKSSWTLRFGDDRALISFGRDTAYGERELATSLFTPERVFIEVHTEVAYPLDHLDLRVELNDKPVTWNGSNTIVAQRDPYDKTKTTYRTARIDLYDRTPPPAEPNVASLRVKPQDKLYVKLDDEALLQARFHDTTIYRTPGDLGMLWKDALRRAAAAKGVTVADWAQLTGPDTEELANISVWTRLSGQKADEISNLSFSDMSRMRVPVTVGDLAALLMFRDEFVAEMTAAQKNPPSITDDADYRGLRTSLKAAVWDPNSAWSYIRITCPKGGECPFPYALSDSYLENEFKDNWKAADQWSLQAVKEGLAKYQQAAKDALARAQAIKDGDIEGLVALLAQDCTSEPLDLPCGYKALRPQILPRLMRLTDVPGTPPRQLWVPDLNARYVLRNLYTLVSAEKSQRDYSKLDTQMAMLALSSYAAPLMLEGGIVAESAAWVVDTAFFGVTLANEIPDAIASRQEVQFALGSSLVMGPERLSKSAYDKSAWFQWMETGGSIASAMVPSVLSTYRVVGEINAAIIANNIKAGGARAYDLLNEVQKNALARMATEAELVKESGNLKALTNLDKEADEAFHKVMQEKGLSPPANPPAKPSVAAAGDPTPKFEELEAFPEEKPNYMAPKEEPEPAPAREAPREKTMPAIVTEAEAHAIATQPPPAANGTWKGVLNKQIIEFQLGKRIGAESAYAQVFEVKGPRIAGCENGCVIKIYIEPGQQEAVPDLIKGSQLLGDDILQPKLFYAESTSTSPMPYLIQERLYFNDTDLRLFDWNTEAGYKNARGAFQADPGLGDALLELAGKISDKGLDYIDANLPNIYFKKVGGKWQCGILDTDFIIEHGKPSKRLAQYYGAFEYETAIGGYDNAHERLPPVPSLHWTGLTAENSIMDAWNEWRGSMSPPFATLDKTQKDVQRLLFWEDRYNFYNAHPDTRWPSAKYTMEKTLERKGYINSKWVVNPNTGKWELQWEGLFIDPNKPLDQNKWKKYFPKLFDRERPVPIDTVDPFFKAGMAEPVDRNVVAFQPRNIAARRQPNAKALDIRICKGLNRGAEIVACTQSRTCHEV